MIGSRGTVLIGQNRAALIGEDVGRDIAAQLRLDGESLSPIGQNRILGTPSLRAGWDGRNLVQVGSPVWATGCRELSEGISAKCSLPERPLCRNGCRALFLCFAFCFFNLSPISHQEPFLVGIFFLRVHKTMKKRNVKLRILITLIKLSFNPSSRNHHTHLSLSYIYILIYYI